MIPLFKPYMPKELTELNSILYSGNLAYGKWGKEFESKLSAFIGNPLILSTNSYTSAIYVALTTLNLKPGDEVIASPMCCLASSQPLVTFGLKIIWADIDPQTGTLSPESVRHTITSKTKLIIHNHFCGYVGYVDEINAIGKENGIPVVDDCIEAFGSEYKSRISGNFGSDITIFSFSKVRLPNTIDGGAISFSTKDLYEKAFLIRDFGICRNLFRDEHNEISKGCDISLRGYGATMSEPNSYIGCMALNEITILLNRQRENANKWLKESLYSKMLSPLKNTIPNYWIFGLLSDNKVTDILKYRSEGYYASGVHLPNNYYSVFGNGKALKGVEEFYHMFIAIPSGWWV